MKIYGYNEDCEQQKNAATVLFFCMGGGIDEAGMEGN